MNTELIGLVGSGLGLVSSAAFFGALEWNRRVSRDRDQVNLERDAALVLACTDDLTDLLNLRGFKSFVASSLVGEDGPWTLVVLDVDRFKAINELVGHVGGNIVLATVGDRLATAAVDEGAAARIGGDEFALLLNMDMATATRFMQRLHDQIGQPIEVKSRVLAVSVSYGLADATQVDFDAMFDLADRAMFKVKRSGGGAGAIAGLRQAQLMLPAAAVA